MNSEHKDLWEQEHTRQNIFTVMHTMRPARPLPAFVDFLKHTNHEPASTTILDLGCGKGRNSVYLASLGFNVLAADFSEKAIADARIRSQMYAGQIQYEVFDLTNDWPYNNNQVDAVIDCNTTIYIPDALRPRVIDEAYRVLKPEGFYLFYGHTADSLKQLLAKPELQLTAYHDKGYAEKRYTRDELLGAYQKFKSVSIEVAHTTDTIERKEVQNEMWVAIFQK